MDEKLITLNNVIIQDSSERLLAQLRAEGLRYRMWVTGTARGSTVHMRVPGLCPEMKARIVDVLDGRGTQLDIEDAQIA
ncbi:MULTISPECIES: hypothetical protein [Methylobacterium]|uniref:hypothetical protein n=1 Tax=Methylobacterium TaxID=407 RepID=UPI00104642A0|nr:MULTISPECIES: hypothetical protein [Methylobacterium]MDR7038553.1 hypothetical protein [Methylobacterium sp. BE186]